MLPYELERFLSGRLRQEAENVGVVLRGEHRMMYYSRPDLTDPLGQFARFVCSCGWEKRITAIALVCSERLTTKSMLVTECLREHALSFTDPNHYTYYPRHAEHGRSN
jgi:hypothetical protein